jgi:probable phosphoglycerate mutase
MERFNKFFIVLVFVALGLPMSLIAGGAREQPQPIEEPAESTLTIYVVRHGQTIFNLMDRVQGISDGILTEPGIAGAVNMGKGLRDIPFKRVYSSDLARARNTALLAMEQNRATPNWTVTEMPELREVSFGIYEGDPNAVMYEAMAKDLGVEYPGNYGAFIGAMIGRLGSSQRFFDALADFNKKVDTDYHISEDASEVYGRLQKGVDTIIAENPRGGNVMLVAHGQSIGFLFGLIKVEMTAQLGNSSVTKIVYDYSTRTFSLDGPIGDMSYAEAGAKQ